MCSPTAALVGVQLVSGVYGAYTQGKQAEQSAQQVLMTSQYDAMQHQAQAAQMAHAAQTQAQASKYQAGVAMYEAGVSNYNARVAENDAEEVRRVGVEKENDQRRRTAALVSKQRAQAGASNVDINSGSALQLQEDSITLGEADALRIRGNFDRQAERFESQADLLKGQSDIFKNRSGYLSNQSDAYMDQSHFHLGQGAAGADMIRQHGQNQASAIIDAGSRQVFGTLLSTGASAIGSGVASKWYTPSSSANSIGSLNTINDGSAFAGFV